LGAGMMSKFLRHRHSAKQDLDYEKELTAPEILPYQM
jgi:hypothetical protein